MITHILASCLCASVCILLEPFMFLCLYGVHFSTQSVWYTCKFTLLSKNFNNLIFSQIYVNYCDMIVFSGSNDAPRHSIATQYPTSTCRYYCQLIINRKYIFCVSFELSTEVFLLIFLTILFFYKSQFLLNN